MPHLSVCEHGLRPVEQQQADVAVPQAEVALQDLQHVDPRPHGQRRVAAERMQPGQEVVWGHCVVAGRREGGEVSKAQVKLKAKVVLHVLAQKYWLRVAPVLCWVRSKNRLYQRLGTSYWEQQKQVRHFFLLCKKHFRHDEITAEEAKERQQGPEKWTVVQIAIGCGAEQALELFWWRSAIRGLQ